MLFTLVTLLGWLLKYRYYAFIVTKKEGPNSPLTVFLEAISDCNMGSMQWFSLAETLQLDLIQVSVALIQQLGITIPTTHLSVSRKRTMASYMYH